MNFGLTSEQEMIIDSVKSFVEKELYPFEEEVEKNNTIEDSVVEQIKQKAIESGLYACNMPCLLYTSPSPRDATLSRMPSSA